MKISDVIFSAMTINDLHKYEIKNYKIINKENNLITFINTNFEIKENDIIFCQSDYLELFFEIFKVDYENITLISSQSIEKSVKICTKKTKLCFQMVFSKCKLFKK